MTERANSASERIRSILRQALLQAGISVCDSPDPPIPDFGGTFVCIQAVESDGGDLELVFHSSTLFGETLRCAVSLKRLTRNIVTTFLLDETEAVDALVSTFQYLRGEIGEILPNLNLHLGTRRINTLTRDKYSTQELAQLLNIKEPFKGAESIFAELRLASETKRKALGKQLRAERVRRGGSEAKHRWTDRDLECLAAKYDDLQPVWVEAKRIAKDAQKSRERTRRTAWRSEVQRAYPFLPIDLIDRFAHPRADDTKPSDIALIHAKRECRVTVDYSARELRKKVNAWKLKKSSTVSAPVKKTRKLKKAN